MTVHYKEERPIIGRELTQLQNEEAAGQAYLDFIKKCVNAWFYRVCMTLDDGKVEFKEVFLYRFKSEGVFYLNKRPGENRFENVILFNSPGEPMKRKIWKMTSMVVPIAPSTFTCEGPPIDDEHLMWVWKNLVSKS